MEMLKVIKTGVLGVNEIGKLRVFPEEYGVQRMISKSNISNIKKSMEQLYIPSVIKVNQDWYILDGQHSKEAIQELALNGAQIVYVMYDTKGRDKEVCVLLNTVGKQWTTNDFLDLWVSCGNNNYIWFKEFQNNHNLNYQTMITLINGSIMGSSTRLSKEFKNGEMVITDEQKQRAIRIGYLLDEIRTSCSVNDNSKAVSKQRAFHLAFIKMALDSRYDHTRMIKKINLNLGNFRKCTNMSNYLDMLQGFYNYNEKGKKRINFME